MKKIILTALVFGTTAALGQVDMDLEGNKKAADTVMDKKGWNPGAIFSFSGTTAENKNVAGKTNGQSTTIGLKLDANANFREIETDWRNNLTWLNGQTKTPVLGKYVKSEDELSASSMYVFRHKDLQWMGPYAKANYTTAAFQTKDVQPDATDYVINNLDGTTETVNDTSYTVSDAFKPAVTKESLGAFVELFKNKFVTAELLAGFGARQYYNNGVYQVEASDLESTVILNELEDSEQVGSEASLIFKGELEKQFAYQVDSNVLLPYYDSAKADNETNFERRVVEVNGKLSYKFTSWLSLDYLYKAVRNRAITKELQTSQSAMLTSSVTLL